MYVAVQLIARDLKICMEVPRICSAVKETVSWAAFMLWERQGSTLRALAVTSSLTTVGSQAHFTVKMLGRGALFMVKLEL